MEENLIDLLIFITIEDNVNYISDNKPEDISYFLSENEKEIFFTYPYELYLPVMDFKTIFCGLGVQLDIDAPDMDFFGLCWANGLLELIYKADLDLCMSDRYTKDYLESVITELKKICHEAIRREEMICWI